MSTRLPFLSVGRRSKSTIIERSFMRQNLLHFNRLLRAVHEFVLAVIEFGGAEVLAERARLEELPRNAFPSRDIQYALASLPDLWCPFDVSSIGDLDDCIRDVNHALKVHCILPECVTCSGI